MKTSYKRVKTVYEVNAQIIPKSVILHETLKTTDRNFVKFWSLNVKNMPLGIDIALFGYIIEKMNHLNLAIIRQSDLANHFKTTRQRISNKLKLMEENNLIIMQHPCLIFINPEIAYRGRAENRMNRISRYKSRDFS